MKKNIIVLIAALPFFSVLLHHYIFAPAGMTPTGFISHDMPYYSANGREIFEAGGNGWAYANPYDTGSPILYFHWLPWLLGFGIKIFHIDPGLQFVILGLISGLLMTRMTYALVETVIPKHDFRDQLFLLIMWGGGLLSFVAFLANLASGEPLWNDLLRFDPFDGLWFLTWGRNLIFSTEALYHFLVAGIWLSLIKKKWECASLGGLALAATHPFSGFQFLSILIAYMLFLRIVKRQEITLLYPTILTIGTLIFVVYYFVFLPSFESHQAVQETWSLAWILPMSSLVLAHAPVGIFAFKNILEKRANLSDLDWLFIISFFVSLVLAKHDLFITPRQPIHFTRGYIWTPLALLALPVLQRILIDLRKNAKKIVWLLILVFSTFLFISDNLVFLYTIWTQHRKYDVYLTIEEKQMYAWLDENEVTGTLLYPNSPRSSYVAATYTETDPYLGHWALTPHYKEKTNKVKLWMQKGGSPAWMNDIDYLLIQEETIPTNFNLDNWMIVHQNGNLILFRQRGN